MERLCDIVANDPLDHGDTLCDRTAMIRAARALLNSVTRVLLLADIVVVKQLLLEKDKVEPIGYSPLELLSSNFVRTLLLLLFFSSSLSPTRLQKRLVASNRLHILPDL